MKKDTDNLKEKKLMKGHSVEPKAQGVNIFVASGLFKSEEVYLDPIVIDLFGEALSLCTYQLTWICLLNI